MKTLTSLLIGSALLASLAGCARPDHAAHPRLLANDAAQISQVDGVEFGHAPEDEHWVDVERVACSRAPEHSPTPRLVLEPVCDVSGIIETAFRID
jgi:hypothetical protein